MNGINPIYKIFIDKNVIHLTFSDTCKINYHIAREIETKIKSIDNPKKILKLIDIRKPVILESEAMNFFQSQRIKKRIQALAILIGSDTNQETLDLFCEMSFKKTYIKLFVEYDSAINWLNSFTNTTIRTKQE